MPKPKTLGKVTQLRLTKDLQQRLQQLMTGQGGYQGTYQRIEATVRIVNGDAVANVAPRELNSLRDYAGRPDQGSWQQWARDVLAHNGLTW